MAERLQLHSAGKETLITLVQLGGEPTTEEVAKKTGRKASVQRGVLATLVENGLAAKTQDGMRGGHRPAKWKITPKGRKVIEERSPERLRAVSEPSTPVQEREPRLGPRQVEVMQHLAAGGPSSATDMTGPMHMPQDQIRGVLYKMRNAGWATVDQTVSPNVWHLTDKGKQKLGMTPGKLAGNSHPHFDFRAVSSSSSEDDDILDDIIEVINVAMMVEEAKPKARRVLRYLGAKGLFA